MCDFEPDILENQKKFIAEVIVINQACCIGSKNILRSLVLEIVKTVTIECLVENNIDTKASLSIMLIEDDPNSQLFIRLAQMNDLCEHSKISDLMSSYFQNNHQVLYRQFQVGGGSTPLHHMFSSGNSKMLEICYQYLEDCPKDSSGLGPLEYREQRLFKETV